jgi:hypothetical protein
LTHDYLAARHQTLGGIGKRSLPMACPFAIGNTFGFAAATRHMV